MALSQSVQQQQVGLYLDNVKSVGFELRKLLEAVDQLVPALPSNTHREVSMYPKKIFTGATLILGVVHKLRLQIFGLFCPPLPPWLTALLDEICHIFGFGFRF